MVKKKNYCEERVAVKCIVPKVNDIRNCRYFKWGWYGLSLCKYRCNGECTNLKAIGNMLRQLKNREEGKNER
jgi:hypothetical protein